MNSHSEAPKKSKSDERIERMTFASVYPHYIQKVEKKGRTEEELRAVICWLTGFSNSDVDSAISDGLTFSDLFEAAQLHPNAGQISGSICGYKVQEIQNPLTRKVRMMDKLVDELAKGKPLNKILRS